MQTKKLILTSLFFIAFVCLATLVFSEHTGPMPSRPLVVCTTSMIGDLVENIAGDIFECHVLMGPGIDPHLYKAREGDVLRFSHAALIIFNGIHLEGKMATLLDKMNRYKPTHAIASTLDQKQIIPHDPHIWHDVKLWIQAGEGVYQKLCSIAPEHREQLHKNWRTYKQALLDLDQWIHSQIEKISASSRALITAHDAFSYFGKSYGIEVRGLAGISTDSDISIAHVQDLAHFIHHNKIKALFVESSIPRRSIQAVQDACHALGWGVAIGPELYSDALGDAESDANTYIAMINHNVDAIVEALA